MQRGQLPRSKFRRHRHRFTPGRWSGVFGLAAFNGALAGAGAGAGGALEAPLFALLAGAAAGLMDAQLQKWLHDEEHREVTAPDVVCSGRGPGCTMPIFP